MKLSRLLPAFNERRTIRKIPARVQAVHLGPIQKELIDVVLLVLARKEAVR